MKRLRYIMLLAGLMSLSLQTIYAQRITRSFRNTSMSEALTILAKSTKDYRINFMYDELEDFTVTTSIVKRTAPDAIRQIMGFYPMKMTIDGENIFVECTQKTPTKMIGRIVDAHHRPVDFANVALLNVRDSSLINGGVTNENGQFVIPCGARKAIVRVSCVGYHTAVDTYNTGKIGSITLKEATMNLQRVIVKAVRPKTKLTREGFQTQVQGTILSDAGMVADLLKQVPRVRVDKDGNCSVFGKGTPEIYVNGRKLTDKNELQTISSKDVKNVTVITTPGAQYDAQVNSVIRITTVKKQGYGWSGNFQAKYGFAMKNAWQEQANLNYRVGGLDVFGGLMWSDSYFYDKLGLDEYINGNQHQIYQKSVGRIDSRNYGPDANLGFNYEFNENHTIGLKYKFGSGYTKYFTVRQNYSIFQDGVHQGDVNYLNDESDSKQTPFHQADFYYDGKIGKWSIDLNASAMWRTKDQIQKATETSSELGDQIVCSDSHTKGKLLAGKLVVSYPLTDQLNIDFGSEYTNSDSHTNNQNEGGVAASNDSRIKEQNIAAFAEAAWSLGDYSLNAGVRYEHVKSDYYAEGVLNPDMSRKYDNVFPNVSLGYDKGKWHSSLSFTAKTYRPSYFRLSGYTRYTSRHSYESGNPNLRPKDAYHLEWDAQYSWLNFSAEYIYNKNASVYMMKPFQDNKDIVLSYYENVDKIQNLKFYLEATPVIGLWHLDYTVGLVNQFFDASKYVSDYNANRPSLYLDLENTWVLPHHWKARLEYAYQSRNYSELGVNYAWNSLDASISKSFLNNRLVVRLEAEDLLHGQNESWKYNNSYAHFTRTGIDNTRIFLVNVTYNFNATKSKYKGTGAGNAEKSRL